MTIHFTKEEKARWPAYATLAAKHGDATTNAIGAFIDWLLYESRYELALWVDDPDWDHGDPYLIAANVGIERLLCEFYGVDYDAYRREREEAQREALEAQRRMNDAHD